MKTDDIKWMELAVSQARLGEGLTRPNPPVGAVVVKNGTLIAKGYHRKAGKDHAEKVALKRAGVAAKGATIYVTLEPCSTHGKTPPCTEWIAAHGIAEVVVAVQDPNPLHHGKGIRWLRKNGIRVRTGICSDMADLLIEGFTSRQLHKKPFVTLKLAQSLDGRIADRKGKSKWITGPDARKYVQDLRRKSDGILVGVGTVLADNPSLLPRPEKGRTPFRIIADSRARVPLDSTVLSDAAVEQTIVAVTPDASKQKIKRIENCGAKVFCVRSCQGHVSMHGLMQQLYQAGLLNVLCEGGGTLSSALLKGHFVNRLDMFIAPCLIGGDGVPSVGAAGWTMDDKPEFRNQSIRKIGKDVLLQVEIEPLK